MAFIPPTPGTALTEDQLALLTKVEYDLADDAPFEMFDIQWTRRGSGLTDFVREEKRHGPFVSGWIYTVEWDSEQTTPKFFMQGSTTTGMIWSTTLKNGIFPRPEMLVFTPAATLASAIARNGEPLTPAQCGELLYAFNTRSKESAPFIAFGRKWPRQDMSLYWKNDGEKYNSHIREARFNMRFDRGGMVRNIRMYIDGDITFMVVRVFAEAVGDGHFSIAHGVPVE